MWGDADPSMTQAEFRAWQRERLPPDNEIPRVISLNADLTRTADRAVTLTHCLVYSRGVSFRLTALFRVDDDRAVCLAGDDAITAAVMPSRPGRPGPDFVLGLVLPDATTLRAPVGERTDGPYLIRHIPQSAHMSGFQTALWLTPLPPPGALTFSAECVSLGVEPVTVTVDGGLLRDTAAGVTALWEWDD